MTSVVYKSRSKREKGFGCRLQSRLFSDRKHSPQASTAAIVKSPPSRAILGVHLIARASHLVSTSVGAEQRPEVGSLQQSTSPVPGPAATKGLDDLPTLAASSPPPRHAEHGTGRLWLARLARALALPAHQISQMRRSEFRTTPTVRPATSSETPQLAERHVLGGLAVPCSARPRGPSSLNSHLHRAHALFTAHSSKLSQARRQTL